MNKEILRLIGDVYRRGTVTRGYDRLVVNSNDYQLVLVRDGGRIRVELESLRVGFIACYYFASMDDFRKHVK